MSKLGNLMYALGNDKPGETVSDILPINRNAGPQAGFSLNPFNADAGVAHPGLPEMVRSVLRGVGDMDTGKLGPQGGLTPDAMSAVLGAGMGAGSLAGPALKEGEALSGVFAGRLAKTADMGALGRAMSLADRKAPAEDIYNATKWFKGADGGWRFEIPDPAGVLKLPVSDSGYQSVPWDTGLRDGKKLVLGDILQHPELYAAYKSLKDMPVESTPLFNWATKGSFNPETKKIQLGMGRPDEVHSTVHHEIQHAIQDIEGFSQGGNNNYFVPEDVKALQKNWKENSKGLDEILKGLGHDDSHPLRSYGRDLLAAPDGKLSDFYQRWHQNTIPMYDSLPFPVKDQLMQVLQNEQKSGKIDDAAMGMYRRLGGEAEARNVQARIGGKHMRVDDTPSWSMSQTSIHDPADAKYPWKTLDVTPDQHLLWTTNGLVYADGTPVPKVPDEIAKIVGGLHGR